MFRSATIVTRGEQEETSIAQADSGHIHAEGGISLTFRKNIIFNLLLLDDDSFIQFNGSSIDSVLYSLLGSHLCMHM